jgi:hypothetical protein
MIYVWFGKGFKQIIRIWKLSFQPMMLWMFLGLCISSIVYK